MFKMFITLSIFFYLGQLEKLCNVSNKMSLTENKLQINTKDNRENNENDDLSNDLLKNVENTRNYTSDDTLNMVRNKRQSNMINLEDRTLSTRRIIPGIISNPNDQFSKMNQSRSNEDPHVIRRKQISNSYDFDKVNEVNVSTKPHQKVSNWDHTMRSQIMEPTKGEGIYDMREAKVMLMENYRVCYACSTSYDVTCWNPDRRTTVKYCRKGHESCLSKTYKGKGAMLIIRDCGSVCEKPNTLSIEEKYSSCSICHEDLCNSNGASNLSVYNTGIAVIFVFGTLFNKQFVLHNS